MSDETTKPNGRREMDVMETDDVKTKIENSGYDDACLRCMAMSALPEMNKDNNDNNNNNNNSSSNTAKRGTDYIEAGENGSMIFEDMIPDIKDGMKIPVKEGRKKDNNKNKRDDNKGNKIAGAEK